MKKITMFLGVISGIMGLFNIIVALQYFLTESSDGASWASLGFFLIALVFLAVAVILSIPFLIFLVKLKFKQIQFYAITHLSYLITSIIIFIISLQS